MSIQILKKISSSYISGIKKNELKKVKETFLVKTNHDKYHLSSGGGKGIMIPGLFHENGGYL
jgi:hypothetical protein